MIEIVAHRGATEHAVENTLPALRRAVALGVDAVEFDVRLTADRVPVVYHYFYLDEITSLPGPIFNYTLKQLQGARFDGAPDARIPTFEAVLDEIGGQIGLEIELKGPEPEAVDIFASVLNQHKPLWEAIEVTSFEPALLTALKQRCPGITVDLLFPRSEPWMRPDVVAYLALHRARLAGARAVHLHPSQLSAEVVATLRAGGIEIHAWDVNDAPTLRAMQALGIPKLCTDHPQQMLDLLGRGAR
ncbi:MAG: glycerophosphodiester phosphodiesterase [Anaerolineae bacterium]|nr:glycerophosphodiester phosphodiesterase [Anaerolineae bacterium]